MNIKISKKIFLFSILTIVFFLIGLYSQISYGLPFFQNGDENAFLKSTLYFFGFFTHANQNLIDPITTPLLNFLISGFLSFIYNLSFINLPLSDFQNFIYLNPDKFFLFSRISSLIVSSLSLFVIFLILKKLKINQIFFNLSFFSIAASPIFLDIGIVAGKNAYLLFFYMVQTYFFLKYINKIEKFSLKSYFIFGILGAIAWGINYWGALPSIYAVFFLHYQKNGFKKVKYIYLFLSIFFVAGFLPNFILSESNILQHLFDSSIIDTDHEKYPNKNRIVIFFQEIYQSIIMIIQTEIPLVISVIIMFFLFFFLIKRKIINSNDEIKIIFTFCFFIFEPILLFAVAEWAYPQFRYFGPSIVILNLLFVYLINFVFENLTSTKTKKILKISFLIIISLTIFLKLNVHYNFKTTIDKNFNQFRVLDSFENEKTIFMFSNMLLRENEKMVNIYSRLQKDRIIIPGKYGDGRNSPKELQKKSKILAKYKNTNISPNSKNFRFFGSEFEILDEEKFIKFMIDNFDSIIIEKDFPVIENILINNKFKREKISETMNILTGRTLLRKILSKSENNYYIGPEIYIYYLR
jgi:hypothetical protein